MLLPHYSNRLVFQPVSTRFRHYYTNQEGLSSINPPKAIPTADHTKGPNPAFLYWLFVLCKYATDKFQGLVSAVDFPGYAGLLHLFEYRCKHR